MVSEAHRRGIVIPDELSVVGFDDTPIAVKIWPPLTTVRQPIVEISDLATQRLVEALRQPKEGGTTTTVHIPFSIIERESTGPVKP